ncbi:unnamed protein product [Kuraishia capsulata CBS 1993]|uniref:Major facilitator superfamily (MFS) profile domain-containing protein n=1 Tax=Kuraishia capsulata CBS 1993 TaxID=1382522 RepID=W6MUF5_9ASCO|nr:uncharacterized protein KUCA_T00005225001 [Kuraishia capsulata CBS 1993]CDK29237.1 unnamed protein product [Kuraishia capsulata CBS 1993]
MDYENSSKAQKSRITSTLYWTVLVTCLGSLQFGYHLGELNAIGRVMSCRVSVPGPYPNRDSPWESLGFAKCIPTNNDQFATVTTLLSAGGLLGSLAAGYLANRLGRKPVSVLNCALYSLGSVVMMMSHNLALLYTGRFIVGIAAGSCLVVAPMLINEVTPEIHRGFMGSMMQFSVSGGILLSQTLSVFWSNDQQWRNMFLNSSMLAVVSFCLTFTTVESPKWLIVNRSDYLRSTEILLKIRSEPEEIDADVDHWRQLTERKYTEADELTELLPSRSRRGSINQQATVSTLQFLTHKEFREQAIAVIGVMTAAQLTGVNSITFYGVDILSSMVSSSVLLINLMVSLVNCTSVGVVSPFVDRLGRKPLLLVSISLMMVSSAVIAFSTTHGYELLASVCVFVFVMGYSLGLGPVPFLIVSELADHRCAGTAQSLGTTMNWVSSIIVSYFFPICLDAMKGYVFYLFTAIGAAYLAFTLKCIPETKGKVTVEAVWGRVY